MWYSDLFSRGLQNGTKDAENILIHSFIQLCTQLKDEAIGVEGINSLNMASGSCKTSKVGSDEDRANASASEALQQQYF
jgi:hypothetical protein